MRYFVPSTTTVNVRADLLEDTLKWRPVPVVPNAFIVRNFCLLLIDSANIYSNIFSILLIFRNIFTLLVFTRVSRRLKNSKRPQIATFYPLIYEQTEVRTSDKAIAKTLMKPEAITIPTTLIRR